MTRQQAYKIQQDFPYVFEQAKVIALKPSDASPEAHAYLARRYGYLPLGELIQWFEETAPQHQITTGAMDWYAEFF